MLLAKSIHVVTVILTGAGFLLRGIWMIRHSPKLQSRWSKILPHLNDTVLLTSAIYLAVQLQQYPFVHAWLTAKLIALLIYIGLGMLAFRFAKHIRDRILAWLAALTVYAYIVATALTRSPLPWL